MISIFFLIAKQKLLRSTVAVINQKEYRSNEHADGSFLKRSVVQKKGEGRKMEQPLIERQKTLLHVLSTLPQKIIKMHGRPNLSEFLLHELCSQQCFNLLKAAYLVNNPDFHCLRGVAGFDNQKMFNEGNIWQKPDEFSIFMTCCTFHNKVRSVIHEGSLKGKTEESIILDIKNFLGFNGCCCCKWNMKHENNGILIFEKVAPTDTMADEHLVDGMSLLSFCPVM